MELGIRGSWKDLDSHYLAALENPWYRGLVEVVDVLTVSTFRYFSSRAMKALQLPITTHSISSPMGLGSDSRPVEIELFGVKTFLADSMQFMLEYGTRLSRPHGCYYLLPSFRGESADERHLCQFYHSEAEIAGGLDDVMALVEDYVVHLAQQILEHCPDVVSKFAGGVSHVEALARHARPLPRLTFPEAIARLEATPGGVRQAPEGFRVLTQAGERALIDQFGGFVWVTEFDHLAVPFYQAWTPDRARARAADLLFGIGEVVGSGERHATGEVVREALALHRVDPQPYDWYISMKDRYPLKTSGFGLGMERLLLWVFDHRDIRDCQILPRFNGIKTIP